MYFVPYVYGMYHTHMVQFCIPYTYGMTIAAFILIIALMHAWLHSYIRS